ncbi:MAG: cadherin-like domain-containing protein [Gammaproteobacteria bacterium]|nr:cadherin-like domain-containing protein [Gammaproteobacteria bacterium]
MRFIATVFFAATLCACGGGGGSGSSSPPPPPANRAPTANDFAGITRPATALSGTLSATDADGDALTFAMVAGPSNGSVTFSGTGGRDFEYTPDGGFAGVDTFTFNASDATVTSNTATATITVNTPPDVNAASYSTSDIGTVSATVTASDAEGDMLSFNVSTAPTRGTITSFDAGTGDFVYTPDPGEDGLDSFAVTASDDAEASAPAVIDIEIFGWVGTQQFGSAADDSLITNGLLINSDGSQTQAGFTEGQVGSTPNAGDRDVFIRSTDRRGNQVSISQFGAAGSDLPRGLFHRPQRDGYYLVVNGPDDNIYRFNSDGTEVYSVPLPTVGAYVFANTPAYWAAVDEDGDIYVLSWVDPTEPTALSALVSKVNGADGTLVWERPILSSAEDAVNFYIDDTNRISPRGIDLDSSGNPVIVGEYWDTGGARPCSICAFIAKLDEATGTDIWVREPDTFANCGVDGSGRLYRVTISSDDSLYVNGVGNFSQFPGADGLLAKYSADGTQELWSVCENPGPDTTFSFTNPLITMDGGIVNYSSLGDSTSPEDPNTGGPSVFDLFVSKYDPDGNLTWTWRYGATKADATGAYFGAGSIAEDDEGILYITGFINGELTAAPSAGDDDAFVIRLGPDGSLQ